MKPSVGRVVLVSGIPQEMNNGADVAPAFITRVWNEHPGGGWVINVRVFCDSENTMWLTSLRLFDSAEDGESWTGYFAYWPPRV